MSDRYGGSRSRGPNGPGRAQRSSSRGQWDDAPAAYDDWGGQGRGGSQGRVGGWDDGVGSGWDAPPARGGSPAGRRSPRADAWDDDQPAAGNWGAQGSWNGSRAVGPAGRAGVGTRRRGRAPLFIALGVIALVVIVGGAFAYTALSGRSGHSTTPVADDPFTAPAGASPTPAPNFKAFSSDRSKFSVTYPAAWSASSDERKVQSQYDYVDKFELQNAPSKLLVEQAGAFLTYTDDELLKAEASNAQQGGVTVTEAAPTGGTPIAGTPAPTATGTPTPAAVKMTVGGAAWLRRDYQVNANGTPMRMVILATHHGGRGYVIVMASSAAEYGNDDQAVFQPMLASFRFAS